MEQVSHSTEWVQVRSSHQHTEHCSSLLAQDHNSCHHIQNHSAAESLHNQSLLTASDISVQNFTRYCHKYNKRKLEVFSGALSKWYLSF